jgi:4-hydroxy-3-polyprenylbenzoate decarboxylase
MGASSTRKNAAGAVSWGSRADEACRGIAQAMPLRLFRGSPASVNPPRLIIAITGATGAIYGVRLLEMLRDAGVETHLVISPWGRRTLLHETTYSVDQVTRLAAVTYAPNDQGAAISSGSFVTMGMAIVPCSMRTLAAVAHGLGDNLVHRAADVILKERRKLLLAPREAPLSDIHLENMLKLSRMGVVICPPMPGFYQRPESLDDLVNHSVVRMLDQFGIHLDAPGRWGEAFALGLAGKLPSESADEF